MKRSNGMIRYGFAVALAGVLLAAPILSFGQTLRLPAHEKVTLKNGLTVLLLEKRGVPIISVVAIVKSGAASDPARQCVNCRCANTRQIHRKTYFPRPCYQACRKC